MTTNRYLKIAAICGAIAVVFGAFGAHILKEKLGTYELDIWKTGVQYHFYHSIVLLVLGLTTFLFPNVRGITRPFWFLFSGILCFSGSLYLLALYDIFHILPKSILGPITPIGGTLFIIGWILMIQIKKD